MLVVWVGVIVIVRMVVSMVMRMTMRPVRVVVGLGHARLEPRDRAGEGKTDE